MNTCLFSMKNILIYFDRYNYANRTHSAIGLVFQSIDSKSLGFNLIDVNCSKDKSEIITTTNKR